MMKLPAEDFVSFEDFAFYLLIVSLINTLNDYEHVILLFHILNVNVMLYYTVNVL